MNGWDKSEDGTADDYRDGKNSFYFVDDDYVFLRLECWGYPDFSIHGDSRYKWFIDTSIPFDMYTSGGNLLNSDYLLYVQDSTDAQGGGKLARYRHYRLLRSRYYLQAAKRIDHGHVEVLRRHSS